MVDDPLSLATDGDFVILCFSLLLPYHKNPFLDLGKNIVKWLGQCFLPELANYRSFLLNSKYNGTVQLCMRIREAKDSIAMDLVIYGARQFGIKTRS